VAIQRPSHEAGALVTKSATASSHHLSLDGCDFLDTGSERVVVDACYDTRDVHARVLDVVKQQVCVTRHGARHELAAGRAVRVLPDHQMTFGTMYVVHPQASPLPPKVRAFTTHLREHVPRLLDPA
jgi:DNA-binding transcriptional LysR family regulator